MRYVYIPKAVELGEQAFDECYNLFKVDGDNIQNIGKSCFNLCFNLGHINLDKIKIIE